MPLIDVSIDEERSEELCEFSWLSVKWSDHNFILRHIEAMILVLFICEYNAEIL